MPRRRFQSAALPNSAATGAMPNIVSSIGIPATCAANMAATLSERD